MPPFDPDEFLRTYKGPGVTLDPNRALAPAATVKQPSFDPEAFLTETGQAGTSGRIPPGKPEERSIGERLQQGFTTPFYGAAQIAARMEPVGEGGMVSPLPTEDREARVAAIDKQVAERERAIQKRAGEGIDWWRLVGEAANPTLYAGALAGGLPGAALTGLTAAVLQPDPNATENFAEHKAKQALAGGVFGLGGGLVTNIAGRVVSPIVGQAAQQLMNRGVQLTPGRLAGQMMSRMEDAARSIPWLGHFIRNAQERTLEGFNLAAINTVLDPIGARLPLGTAAGREAMDAAHTLIDNEYNRLLSRPNLRMQSDNEFRQDLTNIVQSLDELPREMGDQFVRILNRRLYEPLGLGATMQVGQGAIDGRMLQDVQSVFGEFERQYMRSGDPAQRTMGIRFGEVREAILDALQRQNPMTAAEFRDLRNTYAMFIRLQEASGRRAGAGGQRGLMSPMDLGAAVKKTDPTRRKSSYTRGDALMQEFAEWGQFVLPSKLPDSGTPERWLWAQLIGGTAGGHSILPAGSDPYFMKAAATAGVAALPYSRAGQALINYYANSGWIRRGIRNGLEQGAPFAGAPATLSFDSQGNLVTPAEAKQAPVLGQLPEAAARVERQRREREEKISMMDRPSPFDIPSGESVGGGGGYGGQALELENLATQWAQGKMTGAAFLKAVRARGWSVDSTVLRSRRLNDIEVFDPSGKAHYLTP